MIDSVLFAPLLASMFMAIAVSLIGVVAFVRRRSLIGETLSHAAYPGVILAASLSSGAPIILLSALFFALLGLWVVGRLERLKVRKDAALSFVLATFFGAGLLMASRIQFTNPVAYRGSEVYLFGQAATMTDQHVLLYGLLALVVVVTILLCYREIRIVAFDPQFAQLASINVRLVDTLTFGLIALAVVMGVRCVGVVLMSAMLIAPGAAARQFTHKLKWIFLLAALFGAISAFGGVRFASSLPTGPMIVLVASGICVAALLVRIVGRYLRLFRFRMRCVEEHALKALWRERPVGAIGRWMLRRKGYAFGGKLTEEGERQASRIVRLHRLWEVYLVDYLGSNADRVHAMAEEMEHILTPQLERELTLLLNDPKVDPHQQPIPRGATT